MQNLDESDLKPDPYWNKSLTPSIPWSQKFGMVPQIMPCETGEIYLTSLYFFLFFSSSGQFQLKFFLARIFCIENTFY